MVVQNRLALSYIVNTVKMHVKLKQERGVHFMLSSCAVSIKLDNDVYAVYNSLIGDPIFMSSEEYSKVLASQDFPEMDSILTRKGIYVSDEHDDIRRIDFVRNKLQSKAQTINFVMLMMADFCNLACDYCIEKQYERNHGKCMSEEVIDAFFYMVTLGKIKLSSDVEFVLYGGEPLLNFKGIKHFLKKRECLIPKSKCSIVTNAVLLNPEIINYLSEKNVNIGISIDGPKVITDFHRKYKKSNRSVFDDVQKIISSLQTSQATWGMSITITDDLINHKIEFYKWLDSVKPRAIAFNLLKLSFEASEAQAAIEYYKRAADFMIETHIRLVEMGISEKDMARKIGYFLKHQPVISDCAAASINQLTINTDGDIHSCQCDMRKANRFGSVFDQVPLVVPNECITICKNLPINRESCLKCNALPICGGGCMVQGKKLYGSDQYLDQGYCEYAKSIVKWIYGHLYNSIC